MITTRTFVGDVVTILWSLLHVIVADLYYPHPIYFFLLQQKFWNSFQDHVGLLWGHMKYQVCLVGLQDTPLQTCPHWRITSTPYNNWPIFISLPKVLLSESPCDIHNQASQVSTVILAIQGRHNAHKRVMDLVLPMRRLLLGKNLAIFDQCRRLTHFLPVVSL